VIGPGINGKMNELQAALGVLALEVVGDEITGRERVAETYRAELSEVPGLTLPAEIDGIRPNHSYFPILIDETVARVDRDQVYTALREVNVFARKYFYPLCSRFPCYSALPSSRPERLPVAERVSRQILCLPIYGTLATADVRTISSILRDLVTQGEVSRPPVGDG
jgi:dTDP-4-amino-4,6-dideoxygalactose transaminase